MISNIYKVLEKTHINIDIIKIIINNLFKYKWKTITNKIKIRINALTFDVINILSIYNLDPPPPPITVSATATATVTVTTPAVATATATETVTLTNPLYNQLCKKKYYMKYSKPLLPVNINIIEFNNYNYKIKIFESNSISNKYITYYRNGAVIWDDTIPRHSIIFK